MIIDFANRKARPGKAELFINTREVQAIARAIKVEWGVQVVFRHIRREGNSLADWAGNVARLA